MIDQGEVKTVLAMNQSATKRVRIGLAKWPGHLTQAVNKWTQEYPDQSAPDLIIVLLKWTS